MNDALAMGSAERHRDLPAVQQQLCDRQRAFGDASAQGLALEQLHDDVLGAVGVADIEQRTDMRV
jgi:hypothetical protein